MAYYLPPPQEVYVLCLLPTKRAPTIYSLTTSVHRPANRKMRTHIFFIFLAVAALLSVVCEARKKDKDLLVGNELFSGITSRSS